MTTFFTNVGAQFTSASLTVLAFAIVCSVLIGRLYCAALGSAWRAMASVSAESARPSRSLSDFIIYVVCCALLAVALFGVTWHASSGQVTLRSSLIAAGFAWLGFIVSTSIANDRLHDRPFRLALIDAGHWFFVLVAQALVIGLLL